MNSFKKLAGIIAVFCAMILSNNLFSQSFNQGDTFNITVAPSKLAKNTVEVKVRCLITEVSLHAPDDGSWVAVKAVWINPNSNQKIVIKVPILSGTITKEGNYYFYNYLLELTPEQFAKVTDPSKKLTLKSLSKA